MRDMNRSLAIALGLFTATLLSGCGSSTSAPPPPPPPPISVSVSPTSASIPVNATQQFTATLQNDPSNKGVTWALTQDGASCSSECGTLSATSSASGIPITYTAPATMPANPSVTLTATSTADPTKSALATLTVTAPLPISISVSPTSASIPVNATQQFTATLQNDPSIKGVTWALTQDGASCSSECGTLSATSSASGTPITYTAPAKVPSKTNVSIIATSVTDKNAVVGSGITITVGTVKIVPARLNFGTVHVGRSSSPQSTTLTNTGNTTLSVTSVTITGTGHGDFSQTNTCGTSVGAGNPCTITVTFKPTKSGPRSANLSISDNSAGSPQQVPLSGKGSSTLTASVRSALAISQTTAVPSPTGPNNVGTRVMDLVDSSRDDPFLADGSKRELLVRFWYPAALREACQLAQYTSPKTWRYVSQLVGIPLPEIRTNSCLNAPIADGVHPVVVFTPGYTATFTDYTFIFEDLASRGYVVASLAHTYETTAVEFPDGRFVESVLGSHLGKTLRGDVPALRFAMSVRLSDLEFVVNELQLLDARSDSPFAGKLDMSAVALAGHSMGGLSALLGIERDQRFRAGIIIDGDVPDALVSETQTPVLILAAGREVWSDDESRLWANLRGPRLAVNLKGAEHLTPSDAVWLAKDAIATGAMGPEKTMAAVRNYIAAFLDANLRGKPWDPLLIGASSDFPDADVTTQNELLGGEP